MDGFKFATQATKGTFLDHDFGLNEFIDHDLDLNEANDRSGQDGAGTPEHEGLVFPDNQKLTAAGGDDLLFA